MEIKPVEERSIDGLYSWKELMDLKIESTDWLWDGIIPHRVIGFLTGPSDSNKSTFLRQLGFAVAQRKETFLGRKLTTRTGKALIICTEDNATSIAASVNKQTASDISAEIKENLHFLFRIPSLSELDELVSKEKIEFIGYDVWTDTFKGDLNAAIHVRQSLLGLKAIVQKHGCMILCIHHAGKGGDENRPHKGQMLGSQGIEAVGRVVMYLGREEGSNRLLSIVKGNYSSDEIKKQPIMLKLNPETVLLELSHEQPSGYGFADALDREELMPHILKLKEERLSVDKIREELGKLFPDKKIPAHGTVVNWLRESSKDGSQSTQP